MAEPTVGPAAPEPPRPEEAQTAAPPKKERERPFQSVIDSLADLLQMASDFLRQEAGDIVQTKIVKPIQRLGITVSSAMAAGCLAAVGLVFIAVALFIWLGQLITYPGALALIGAVYLIGSIVFLTIRIRTMQR